MKPSPIQSIRELLQSQATDNMRGLQILIVGEKDEIIPPMIGISIGGSDLRVTNGVTMYGVYDFDIAVELFTVPQDDDQDGTPTEAEQAIANDIHSILADRCNIDWVTMRNGWEVLDIFATSPITEAEEGRRKTSISLAVVARTNT
jgi:hypothetical protein